MSNSTFLTGGVRAACAGLLLALGACNEQCPCPNPGPGWCQEAPGFHPVGCDCPSFKLCPGFCLPDGGAGPAFLCDAG